MTATTTSSLRSPIDQMGNLALGSVNGPSLRWAIFVLGHMNINRENLAWAAGIFEGEGCFSFMKSSRAISACVVSTDKDVLDGFCKVIGFGRVLGPYKNGLAHWKMKYRWVCSSFEDTQVLIAMLWPWLKSRRRAKAAQILRDYIAGVPESIKNRPHRNTKIRAALAEVKQVSTAGRWRFRPTQGEIAKRFGVSDATVWQIKHGVAAQ